MWEMLKVSEYILVLLYIIFLYHIYHICIIFDSLCKFLRPLNDQHDQNFADKPVEPVLLHALCRLNDTKSVTVQTSTFSSWFTGPFAVKSLLIFRK